MEKEKFWNATIIFLVVVGNLVCTPRVHPGAQLYISAIKMISIAFHHFSQVFKINIFHFRRGNSMHIILMFGIYIGIHVEIVFILILKKKGLKNYDI